MSRCCKVMLMTSNVHDALKSVPVAIVMPVHVPRSAVLVKFHAFHVTPVNGVMGSENGTVPAVVAMFTVAWCVACWKYTPLKLTMTGSATSCVAFTASIVNSMAHTSIELARAIG